MVDAKKVVEKKGFFARLMESLDKKMEASAKGGCCCCGPKPEDKKEKKCC